MSARHRRACTTIIALVVTLCLSSVGASSAPWCANTKESLTLFYRNYNAQNLALPCTSQQEAAIIANLSAAGFAINSYSQTGLVTTAPPTMNATWFIDNISQKTALVIATHGTNAGAVGVEYYDPYVSASTLLNRLSDLRTATGYQSADFSIGHHQGPSFILSYIINITGTGLENHCRTLGTGCIADLQYCNSMIDSLNGQPTGSGFNAAAEIGYAQEEQYATACANSATFWSRLGGSLGPDTEPNVWNAIQTAPALPDIIHGGSSDIELHCAGTDQHSTQFMAFGAFADTAFCLTQNESYSDYIVLRGFINAADYPVSPVILDTLDAVGGPGVWQPYRTTFAGSFALLDWAEVEITGRVRTSPPFEVGTRPSYLDLSVHTVPTDVDSLGYGEDLTTYSGEAVGVSEANCADIVVYSCADSLAEPVRAQIATDNPTKRVRKIIGLTWLGQPDHSAQACKRAIADVVAANAEWNENCGTLFNPPCNGHYYPVAPGPELYIVGYSGDVNLGAIGHESLACGGHDCRSDYAIYDLDNDEIPEGPVSRIPASNIRNATRAAIFAQDWNRQRNVDTGRDLVLLAGDMWNGGGISYPSPLLASIATDFTAVGYRALPILKESSYGPCDAGGRINALKLKINAGVKELFGMGTYTNKRQWPGLFAIADGSQYTRKQRFVAWLPGCEMHDIWKWYGYDTPCGMPDSSIGINPMFMFNDTTRTGLAAAVSHLEPGFEKGHQLVAQYLSAKRKLAAQSSTRVSVARVAYDAVVALITDHPEFKDHAASVSVWGSYANVPAEVTGGGGGGCPVADALVSDGWTTVNTLLARSATGTLATDALRLPAPVVIANRVVLRLRENEQEITTLDRVALAYVDHEVGSRLFAKGNGFILGQEHPAVSITDNAGRDLRAEITGLGAEGFLLQPGDTLYVSPTESPAVKVAAAASSPDVVQDEDEGFEMESSSKDLPPDDLARARDSFRANSMDARILAETGILIQAPDGDGGWRTVLHYYPRQLFDRTLVDSIGAGPVRLVAVGMHKIRFLGHVTRVGASSVTPTIVAPVSARHSRFGNVLAKVTGSDTNATTLAPGDTLQLGFSVTGATGATVRDYFLLSRGVYSSIGDQSAGGAGGIVLSYQFALGLARPNPATDKVTIDYSLGAQSQATLRIYSVAGRLVRTLVDGVEAAGPHQIVWDGKDDHSQLAHPGVYFYRLNAGSWASDRKVVLIQR